MYYMTTICVNIYVPINVLYDNHMCQYVPINVLYDNHMCQYMYAY